MGSGGGGLYSDADRARGTAADVAGTALGAVVGSAGAAAGGISYIVGTGTAVVGAAGPGATALAPAAGIGPVGWIIIGAAIIGSFLLRGKKRLPPPEASGIRLRQPVDANAPMPVILGQPWFTPPLAIQYAIPGSVNSLQRSRKNRTVRVFHCGVGQYAGTDLRVRAGGIDLYSAVTLADPGALNELTLIANSDRRRWGFPVRDVLESSVLIYFDSTLRYAGDAEAGHDPASVASESIAATAAEARLFQQKAALFATTALVDADMPAFDVRLGCLLPKSGIIDEASMKAEALFKNATSGKLLGSGSWFVAKKSVALGPKDFGIARTDDARQYLWARIEIANRTLQQVFAQGIVSGFRVAYSLKPTVFVDIRRMPDGSTEAAFGEPVPASVAKVKATYKAEDKVTRGDGFRIGLTDGSVDQDALGDASGFFGPPSTSTRSTMPVGLLLDKGAKRRHSTTTEVDELVVGIEAGPRGFQSIDSDGDSRGATRDISIRLKETAAADAPATAKNDPSTGWVELANPTPGGGTAGTQGPAGPTTFRLNDRFTGPGTWFFSCADLLAYTRETKAKPGAANWLPARKYDVEVVGLDAANTDSFGVLREDRYFSELWFQHATEVRRIGFVLPRQSMLSLETGEDFDDDGLVECRFAGRICIIPGAGATVGADGLPAPRTVAYSRNPVWLACNWLVDPVGGAGRFFGWADVLRNVAEARDAAAFCDATIQLRDGTSLVRSMCDLAIGEDGERMSCGDWLARILAGSGVFAYWRGGWRWAIDRDAEAVTDTVTGGSFVIDEDADCVPGGCEMAAAGVEEVPSELHVEFRDGDNRGARTVEPIALDDPQPSPRVVERVEFPAVTRRGQAVWAGTQLLRQMRGNGTVPLRSFGVVGTFGRGLRMLQLDPGDIVLLTSARLGITALKCRVMEVGWTSGLRPGVQLAEHVPSAYSPGFQGPNSATPPGTRQASDDPPKVSKLSLSKVVESSYSLSAGGKP